MKTKLEKINEFVHPAVEIDQQGNEEAGEGEESTTEAKPAGQKKTLGKPPLSSSIASSPRGKNTRLQQARDIMARMKSSLNYRAKK